MGEPELRLSSEVTQLANEGQKGGPYQFDDQGDVGPDGEAVRANQDEGMAAWMRGYNFQIRQETNVTSMVYYGMVCYSPNS